MNLELQRIIEAIREGDLSTGYDQLTQLIRKEPNNEDAWMLLAGISDSDEKRRDCYIRVVKMNPNNHGAAQMLEELNSRLFIEEKEAVSPILDNTSLDVYLPSDEPEDLIETLESGSEFKPKFKKTQKYWEQPFESEQEVIETFQDYLTELQNIAGIHTPELRNQINSLDYTQRQYTLALEERKISNIFLAPGARAAIEIAEELLKQEMYLDSFWIGNIFGEYSKILISRNREKFGELFEKSYRLVCNSISGSWLLSPTTLSLDSDKVETNELEARLQKISQFALGTYFNKKHRKFLRNYQPDEALQEREINETLARHFDRRLKYLLKHDRPKVKQYVTENMPVIYKLNLDDTWDSTINEWEKLLHQAAYDDLLRYLKSTGVLVRASKIGEIDPSRLDDIRRAAALKDFGQVAELLEDNANELKTYLYSEAQLLLDYREPPQPELHKQVFRRFSKARHLSRTNDPDKLQEAFGIIQDIWEKDIRNLELRDWVAYLHAKNNNLPAAEQMLDQIRKRRDTKQNFYTDWNLAVLAYDRKDEKFAYQLLTPLLEQDGGTDEDLVLVVLALSLKLDDKKYFLDTIPLVLNLKYHPLAVVVAYELQDERVELLLTPLLSQTEERWELPTVGSRFANIEDLQQTVNKAIVEGQVEQLVAWLEARITSNKGWIPNYLALAQILEEECHDIDGAFKVLQDRLSRERKSKKPNKRFFEDACRDLLNFCKRNNRRDLGQRAYRMVEKAGASDAMLNAYSSFQEKRDVSPPPPKISPASSPPEPRDPKLAERLAWVTARLSGIRNSSVYIQESQAISEFCSIVTEMNPESSSVVRLINDISSVIAAFSNTDTGDYDSRQTLYNRTVGYERRLEQLLTSGALSNSDVIRPYHEAIKQVLGDLSRRAGLGPNIVPSVENTFISLENNKTKLTLRIKNASERLATDIGVELIMDTPQVRITGPRETIIEQLASQESQLISYGLEKAANWDSNIKEVKFGVSLRASAEGFPNVDLGIIRRNLPLIPYRDIVGADLIPKLFQPGRPLQPALADEPELFQGRNDILNNIKGSFHGGIQRERYFLDGIRRVGKTSILNFLPSVLPVNVIPVLVNLEKFGLSGSPRPPFIVQHLCRQIYECLPENELQKIVLPDQEVFETTPSQAFESFLKSIKDAMPDKTPLLMIDEFQELLQAIANSNSGDARDPLVLDLLRGHSDEGSVYAIFTGSVRFDYLSEILHHRIFGSLTRLRVSFLSENDVEDVLNAGLSKWATLPKETVRKIHALTGGYPRLTQIYGRGIVEILNNERRTYVTPDDIDIITQNDVISNDELFNHWWPVTQLGSDEEQFIEWMFKHYQKGSLISTREFFASIHNRDLPKFRKAFDNLRACEVLDSKQTEYIRFSGLVLREWLEQQMLDGHLRVRVVNVPEMPQGYNGIFIDHENFVKTIERISLARGIDTKEDRTEWFSSILKNVLDEVEHQIGLLTFKSSVAFWDRPNEAELLPAYFKYGFTVQSPEKVKMKNAADFKLVSEIRRSSEQAMREGTRLRTAIIVTGDGDLSHEARALVNDGLLVQLWGGSKEINQEFYLDIVGAGNVVLLDDIISI